jgi:hypothetical protein
VPNAGGAPAGASAFFLESLPHPAAALNNASVECVKNARRESDI